MHPNPHPGDDAEDALRPDQQLPQVRAGRRLRCAAEIQRARGRDDVQPTNHVVEPAVPGRVLSRRSSRGITAQAGEFEALRKMPERKPVLNKQLLGPWTSDAGTELGLAGYRVESEQLVEAPQIQRHHGAEFAADGIESTDHAG